MYSGGSGLSIDIHFVDLEVSYVLSPLPIVLSKHFNHPHPYIEIATAISDILFLFLFFVVFFFNCGSPELKTNIIPGKSISSYWHKRVPQRFLSAFPKFELRSQCMCRVISVCVDPSGHWFQFLRMGVAKPSSCPSVDQRS